MAALNSQDPAVPPDLDVEAFEDYRAALEGAIPQIESELRVLHENRGDGTCVAALFRQFHNMKGDAALCRFEVGVQLAHGLEEVLARIRDGRLRFTGRLGDAIMLTLDRLEQAADAVANGMPLEPLRLPALLDALDRLSCASQAQLDELAGQLLARVSGFLPAGLEQEPQATGVQTHRASDLDFFRGLALQLEQRASLFQGRTRRILDLALSINEVAGHPVPVAQLAAAVYMHDVGMMFLAEPIWLKAERLSEQDRQALRVHPVLAAGLLERMPGWEEAARMVAQHHEMQDGRGYPHGLLGDQICAGAKLIAIVDAFEAVMMKQMHRGQQRSMLRAAAEVNASEQQFASEWIGPFNQVVRRLIEG